MKTIKDYFSIKELVCKDVADKWGDVAWNFFDPRLLETILFIRGNLGKPMTINNWASGGTFSQRGFRCNLCDLVKGKKTLYCSSHMRGQGVDFDVKGMSAEAARQWIINNAFRFPYPIRLEKDVNWVHLDVCNCTTTKVIQFVG